MTTVRSEIDILTANIFISYQLAFLENENE
jgi:hypothetical protein